MQPPPPTPEVPSSTTGAEHSTGRIAEVRRRSFVVRWCRRHDQIAVTLLLTLMSVAAFPDVWLRHEALAPTDLSYFYSPWSRHATPDIVPGSNPVMSDLVDMFYPQMEYVRQRLLDGDIPFWCDKIQNGTPLFLVIKHELMTAPLLLLILLLKVPAGVTVFFIFRHLIGGLFFYKYGRIIGLRRWPSLCGTIVFCYCKYTIQDFILPMDLQLFLIPVAAYGTERIIRSGSLLWIWLIPILHWMNIASGFPAGTAYCLYFLALYAAWRAMAQPGRRLRLLGLFALLNVIAVLAAMPALVATADFFSGFDWSYREAYWRWHLPVTSLMTWVYPILYGPPYARGTPIGWWYEYAFYIGVLPLLVLLQGMAMRRVDNVKLFHLLFTVWLIAILYNLGNVLEHVVQHLPIFNSNPNTRQKMLLAFTLAILLGYALNDLSRVAAWLRRFASAIAATVVLVACWFAWRFAQGPEASRFVQSAFWLQSAVVVASLIAFLLLLRRGQPAGWLKAGIVLLLFVDLQVWDKSWFHLSFQDRRITTPTGEPIVDHRIAVGWNPTIRREAYFPKLPALTYLSENLQEHKMLALNTACLANIPLHYGINNFSGRGFFDPRQKGLYRLVNEDAFTGGQNTAYLFESSLRTRLASPIIDALSIKFVVLDHRQQIDDLQRDYAVKQTEWNAQIDLAPGDLLKQTFTATRSIKLDRCSIHIAQGRWTHASPAELRMREMPTGKEWASTAAEWRPALRRLEFHLDAFAVQADHEYELELFVRPDAGGPVDVLCTRDVDILRSGTIEKDGRAWPGDLTFSLFADRGNQYIFRQPEWNDTATLSPGESLSQTFTANRSLKVDRCEIRIAENHLAAKNDCRLTLIDNSESWQHEWEAAKFHPETGTLSFELAGHAIQAGHQYELQLSVPGDNAGRLLVLCTQDADLIPDGDLTVGTERRTGDITASLLAVSIGDIGRYRVVYDNEIVILENTRVYGRAWLAGGLSYATPEEVLSSLAGETGDLRRQIWAEEDMRAIAGEPRAPSLVRGKVEALELRSSRQRFAVEAEAESFLVVSDNYDHGWRAFIDGRETGVFRANYNLRAVRLPSGSHEVEFVYRPPHLALSLLVAFAAIAGHLGLIVRLRRRSATLPPKAARQ